MVADAMICSNIMSFYTIIFTLPFTSVRTVSGALFFLCFYLSTTTVATHLQKYVLCEWFLQFIYSYCCCLLDELLFTNNGVCYYDHYDN